MNKVANPVLEVINCHASVRNYKPDPVPREMTEAIVAAAQRSSTSSNLQAWTVVAVTGAERRADLARLCGDQAHVVAAPLFLAWCADLSRLDRACELRGYEQVTQYVENFLVAAVDTGIAAQTAALAAESFGLGICYIGAIRNSPEAVAELLSLPRLCFPITGMTIGWPASDPGGETPVRPQIKPRLPLGAVLHWDRYDANDLDSVLHEYDAEMVQTGIYQGRQVPVPGRPGDVEDYGWLEHSARRVSQPWRTGLRATLRERGFDLE